MRPLHDTVAKEKCAKIFLIEAGNAANSGLLASFLTKSREILAIFTRECIVQRPHYNGSLKETALRLLLGQGKMKPMAWDFIFQKPIKMVY